MVSSSHNSCCWLCFILHCSCCLSLLVLSIHSFDAWTKQKSSHICNSYSTRLELTFFMFCTCTTLNLVLRWLHGEHDSDSKCCLWEVVDNSSVHSTNVLFSSIWMNISTFMECQFEMKHCHLEPGQQWKCTILIYLQCNSITWYRLAKR